VLRLSRQPRIVWGGVFDFLRLKLRDGVHPRVFLVFLGVDASRLENGGRSSLQHNFSLVVDRLLRHDFEFYILLLELDEAALLATL